MRDLERRPVQVEQAARLTKCYCATPIMVLAGDPDPGQPTCPQHGRSRVIRWLLPRSPLDGT